MARPRSKRLPKDEYSDYYDEEYQTEHPRRRKRRNPDEQFRLPPAIFHLLILAGVAVILLGLIWMVAGWPMLEVTLRALLAPVGLIWSGLFLALYFNLLKRQPTAAFLTFGCWLILTLAGNTMVANGLARSLQGEYEGFDLNQLKPLDVVLVLGGGQTTNPDGKAQISTAGDRALVAWQLMKQSKADLVICGGSSSLPLAKGELSQADALEQLLLGWGVPGEKIVKIGGRNTLQEMQAFDRWLTSNDGAKLRKGVVTSAWHLPRAMRLARTVGIPAEPIPADFINVRFVQTPHLLIPGADNLSRVTALTKEYLAGLVGR